MRDIYFIKARNSDKYCDIMMADIALIIILIKFNFRRDNIYN